MSFNKVNNDGSLTVIAGGTNFADLPICSWIKWDDQTNLPEGFLKVGDSIPQATYPEAYAEYGATVPYKADTSELSNFEAITLPMTAPYDGFITASAYDGGYITFSVNATTIYVRSATTGVNADTITVPIHKGDTVTFEAAIGNYYVKARYYKKSLILKAKSFPIPADFMDAVEEAVDEAMIDTYSTSEVKTNKVWIDGKPIYRTVITGNTDATLTEFNVTHNIANIEWVTSVGGGIFNDTAAEGNDLVPFGFYNPRTDVVYYLSVLVGQVTFRLRYCASYRNMPYKAVLEYTKTTD